MIFVAMQIVSIQLLDQDSIPAAVRNRVGNSGRLSEKPAAFTSLGYLVYI